MRNSVSTIAFCASVIIASQAVAAPKRGPVRRAQLISMTGPAPLEGNAGVSDRGEKAELGEAPPLPESFQVHDLSRRYVQFRMQQEMAATAQMQGPSVGPATPPAPVAAISSIAVPSWLRGGTAPFQSVSFKPGCAPLAYRPSGFLTRGAEARRAAFYGMMSAIACEQGIPAGLFDAMIIRESGYNPVAVSSANAYGLAQLMPGTAFGLGVDRYDPLQNMRGGARYLRQQLDRFGQVHLALAAYNAGPGRVRGGLVPRITETQAYVSNIIANWSRLTSPPGSTSTVSTLPQVYRSVALTQF
ncbi:lytic transglycosylase domain-containing protein [Sphingomonas sanguinis]|nr:lytic transglycosylase domain-containing protein [Sphingomonas sanguinis]